MEPSFAVIGHPLGHTMSPFIHKALFALSGKKASYFAEDIAPEKLGDKIKDLHLLSGYNITIPHKQAIIPYLDRLDESAARYGAVNAVKTGEKCIGYNTDAYGFLKALEVADIPVKGHVLLCGCGGVARTMAYECLLAGCSVTFSVLTIAFKEAEKLSGELKAAIPNAEIFIKEIGTFVEPCDLLINATPVGMYPKVENMPVSEDQLKVTSYLFDAVYNPRKTQLLKAAEKRGIPHGEGMAMLVWQAARAHEIWYGAEFRTEDIAKIIEDSYKEMEKSFA